MAQPTISVLGAGIAGLTLGQCLRRRGLNVILYERSPASKKASFGITLHHKAYKPLLEILDLDEAQFRQTLAVDAPLGGIGNLPFVDGETSSSCRVQRAKLEDMLREGLDIKWEHALSHAQAHPSRNSTLLSFGNDSVDPVETPILVACDGVHSQIRKSISAPQDNSQNLKVLPLVVYTGTRRVPYDEYKTNYLPHFSSSTTLHTYVASSSTLLHLHIDDVSLSPSSSSENSSVKLRYIYSRPPRPDAEADPLHNPSRSKPDASAIPTAFYDELAALPALPAPYDDAFAPAKVRADRVLHWLMRSSWVDHDVLRAGAASQGVLLIGDAAHAEPILGGEGANAAICDAVELAEHMATAGTDADSLSGFYDVDRLWRWAEGVSTSEKGLVMMHESLN